MCLCIPFVLRYCAEVSHVWSFLMQDSWMPLTEWFHKIVIRPAGETWLQLLIKISPHWLLDLSQRLFLVLPVMICDNGERYTQSVGLAFCRHSRLGGSHQIRLRHCADNLNAL